MIKERQWGITTNRLTHLLRKKPCAKSTITYIFSDFLIFQYGQTFL